MDDEASLVLAFENLRNDLVEGHDFNLDAGREQLKRQVGSGEFAGHGDLLAFDFILCERTSRDQHRPVTVAHAASARHQRIVLLNVRERMKRNRSYVVDALLRLTIQGLNVAKGVAELQSRHTNLIRGQTIKHEGVVGVRAMGHGDFANGRRYRTHKIYKSCSINLVLLNWKKLAVETRPAASAA